MTDRPHETTEEYPGAWMVLDREQPVKQAGETRLLLEMYTRLREAQTPETHHWSCLCVRQN